MSPLIALFALVTLTPVALLAAGALLGGGWLVAALLYITLFAGLMDRLIAGATRPAAPGTTQAPANALSALLAVLHFPLLYLAVWAVAGQAGLAPWERLVAFLAFGLFFGQVSNANAHELIHRSQRALHELGKWVYVSLMFGHHTSAHRYVHHVHVGTEADPNTAREGESFYHFAPRAWVGSFRAGLAEENRRRKAGARGLHPYVTYVAGGLVALALSWLLAGAAGVAAHLALAGHATMQLLLSDYVQHYGLRRKAGPDGRPEPVGPQHSWNTPHRFTSLMMLNAPRHSDHHLHPARPYPELELEPTLPMLPCSLPVAGTLALFPRRWKRIMGRRLARWRPDAPETAPSTAGRE